MTDNTSAAAILSASSDGTRRPDATPVPAAAPSGPEQVVEPPPAPGATSEEASVVELPPVDASKVAERFRLRNVFSDVSKVYLAAVPRVTDSESHDIKDLCDSFARQSAHAQAFLNSSKAVVAKHPEDKNLFGNGRTHYWCGFQKDGTLKDLAGLMATLETEGYAHMWSSLLMQHAECHCILFDFPTLARIVRSSCVATCSTA